MRYLLLLYENEAAMAGRSQAERTAELHEYLGVTAALKGAGQFLGGEPLESVSTATTVRIRDGKTVTTDGPFAETKEQLGGFYMVEAKDLDEALAVAARIPAARTGCVEVRPILELPEME
ncbi:MAG: YciI family protein [Myxococcales bacterium]|nr:YciI family protein [Myxococcales bacterium]